MYEVIIVDVLYMEPVKTGNVFVESNRGPKNELVQLESQYFFLFICTAVIDGG